MRHNGVTPYADKPALINNNHKGRPKMQASEKVFDARVASFVNELEEIATDVANQPPVVDRHFVRLQQLIRNHANACLQYESTLTEEECKAALPEFRAKIRNRLDECSIMSRALAKPRGFSGDHAMLTRLYDDEPQGTGIGGYLDLWCMNCDLTRAVRARMEAARQLVGKYLSSFSTGSTIRVLNVASGPCREYFVGLEYPRDRDVIVTCLDNDSEALSYVENRAQEEKLHEQFVFEQYNALRLKSGKRNIEKFGLQDLVYSIGLFDYIPDAPLIAILEGLRETVKPGGTVYLAFKDELRYNKAEYQWFMNWFFFQRTEEECRDLLVKAGFDTNWITAERDRTGIIINFTILVPDNASQVRIDDAHETRRPQHADAAKKRADI